MTPAPLLLLREYSGQFPRAWRQIAQIRHSRGETLDWWPDWCYCPIAASVAIISEGNLDAPWMLERIYGNPPAIMSALAAWRITKGIYRIEPTLFQELWKMPLVGNLPVEVFYLLPEWCIYIETPGIVFAGNSIAGFFAYLEYDVNDGRHELRLELIGLDLDSYSVILHLGDWDLKESMTRAFKEAYRCQHILDINIPEPIEAEINNGAKGLTPFLNLVLYICSVNADFGRSGKPNHPSKGPTRKGKLQVANEPRTWEVGVRIGPAIKRASATTEAEPGDRTHASPRPHYRRAHWHHYWTGPRNDPQRRNLILKWLPPIPVGMTDLDGEESTPVVVRPIKK